MRWRIGLCGVWSREQSSIKNRSDNELNRVNRPLWFDWVHRRAGAPGKNKSSLSIALHVRECSSLRIDFQKILLFRLNLWLKHNLQRVHFKSVNSFLLAETGWLSTRELKLSEASWSEFYQRGRAIWSVFGGSVIIIMGYNLVDCPCSWIPGTGVKLQEGGTQLNQQMELYSAQRVITRTKIQIFTRGAIIWEQIRATANP